MPVSNLICAQLVRRRPQMLVEVVEKLLLVLLHSTLMFWIGFTFVWQKGAWLLLSANFDGWAWRGTDNLWKNN
jgi:hypothetical protein